jgi:glycosyltransferase involved in cell wall biosynthesis
MPKDPNQDVNHVVDKEADRPEDDAHRAPRVAMLVANGVAGDSRVQKIAWSMAAAGWDVTVFGRAPGNTVTRFRLGRARVVLVPVPAVVSGYERIRRRGGFDARRLRPGYRAGRATVAAWDVEVARASRASWPSRLRVGLVAGLRGWLARHPRADAEIARAGRGRIGGSCRAALDALLGLVDRHGGWRRLNPWFRDLELALAPEVARYAPDLIHAHDFHMVGIGARLAARLSTPEHRVPWIYDAHEYLAGIDVPSRFDVHARLRRRMLVGTEREYIGWADGVVTVSDGIAARLRIDHRLSASPHVVLNAPVLADPLSATTTPTRRLRDDVGVADDVPLLVYSGGMSWRRGVDTAIDALTSLPGVHLALVAREEDPDVPGLIRHAAERSVEDRVHVVPYVPVDQVVDYVAGASIGLVPILHRPNHELSLITKYFEYLHARLPIITSDVREMAEAVRRTGVGEVFTAADAVSLAEAVRRVLATPERYRAVYQGPDDPRAAYRWERQAKRLDALYRELTGAVPGPAVPAGELSLIPEDATSDEPKPAQLVP